MQAQRAIVFAILGLATALRVWRLGVPDVWLDEAFSYDLATRAHWLAGALADTNPPLYSLLLRPWLHLTGASEVGLRAPSCFFGIAFVAVTVLAACRLFDTRTALWSGLWAAVSPIHVYYSQEARGYALLVLLLLLTHVEIWRALAGKDRRSLVYAGLAALAALYTHYLAALGLAGAFVWPVVLRSRTALKRLAWSALAVAALFAPWLAWSFLFTPHPLHGIVWVGAPIPQAIVESFEVFGLGERLGATRLPPLTASVALPVGLRVLGQMLLGLVAIWLALPFGDPVVTGEPSARARRTALAAAMVLPLVLLWLVSLVQPVYEIGRYDMIGFPLFPLLLGLGFAKLHGAGRGGGFAAACVAGLLLLPIAARLARYERLPASAHARRTAAVLDAQVADGDLVIFTGLRGLPVLFQLARVGYVFADGRCSNPERGRRFGCRLFPIEDEARPAEYDPRRITADPSAAAADLGVFLDALPGAATVAVVVAQYRNLPTGFSVNDVDASLLQALQRAGFSAAAGDFDLGILRYVRARR